MKKIKTIILLILTIFSFSSISFAEIYIPENKIQYQKKINQDQKIFDIVTWTLSFIALLDSIYVLYNFFGYMYSGKEVYSSGIKKGLVGMLILFLSYSVVKWLQNLNNMEVE